MARVTLFGGGASSPTAPDVTPEIIGTVAGGTTITAAGSTNTMGTYTQLAGGGVAGVTENDWSGFWLCLSAANTGTNRYLAKVSIDGGSTDYLPPIFAMPSNAGGWMLAHVPLEVPAGSDVRVAVQSPSASASLQALIIGDVYQGSGYQGFNVAESVSAAVTGTSRGASTSVSIGTDATTFTQVNAGLSNTYGAFLVCLDPVSPFFTGQPTILRLGHGAGNTLFGAVPFFSAAATLAIARFARLFEVEVASGETISVNAQAASASDAIYPNIIGFRRA